MAVPTVVIFTVIAVVSIWPQLILGHARLWEPPGRSTMWRRGYNTPTNYQDNELYCGGFFHQVSLGYKCGICGDPYDGRRENEAGGKYAKGIVTRTFKQGQAVTFQVDITANHKGYIEFKICPTNNPNVKETQDCFDRYPLALADGSGTKYFVPSNNAIMNVNVVLPRGLVCNFCVVQMLYNAGNSWGTNKDGRSCVGCGHQEQFYGCADIKILPDGSMNSIGLKESTVKPREVTTVGTKSSESYRKGSSGNPRLNTNSVTKASNNFPKSNIPNGYSGSSQGVQKNGQNVSTSNAVTEGPDRTSFSRSGITVPTDVKGENMICRSLGDQVDLNNWCQLNCQLGFCPSTHCTCVKGQYPHATARQPGCRAAGAFAAVSGLDQWCRDNCAAGNCPSSHCVC